jgi:hypothetical protein
MKRIISSNNIPLILNSKYAWKIINDPQCGEIYQISLGDPYVDKYREAYDLIYYARYSKLLLHIGLSEEDDIPKVPMIMKFEETELIIDWILKGTGIKLLPLHNAGDYKDGKNTNE